MDNAVRVPLTNHSQSHAFTSVGALALSITLGILSLAFAQSDRDAVLATLDAFLGAMKQKDTVAMAMHTDSLTRMTLLRPGPNGIRVVALATRARSVLRTRAT